MYRVLTVKVGEVTTLDHEVLDNTVENRALKAKFLFSSCQSSVIPRVRNDSFKRYKRRVCLIVYKSVRGSYRTGSFLRSSTDKNPLAEFPNNVSCLQPFKGQVSYLWNSLSIETHHNSSDILIAMLDIKIDLGKQSTRISFMQLTNIEPVPRSLRRLPCS